VTVQVPGGTRRRASGPPRSGVVLGGGDGGRRARQLPFQGAGGLVGGERGPGGGQRGQHGEGVGPPVRAAAGVAGGLAAVRQHRLELGA
jgi:hypothetical protein